MVTARKRSRASRPSQGTATLQDVAKRAGVSSMTVSNVINGVGGVSARTRAKVLGLVNELGYSPNVSARRLAGGGDQRIAYLTFANGNPTDAEATTAAVHSCAARGVQLTIIEVSGEPFAMLQSLRTKGISSVIIPSFHGASEEFLGYARQQGLAPVALLPGTRPVEGYFGVWVDDRSASYDATALLISLGHRRIAHISGPAAMPSSRERGEGFRLAMSHAGLPAPAELLREGSFDFRSGLVAAESLLSLPDRPTAIFAASDDMAAGVLTAAYRHQLKVPEELAVMGFDDNMLATRLAPQLSTVHQPIHMAVDAAVELAMTAARGERSGEEIETSHRKLPYRIIERETTCRRASTDTDSKKAS